MDGLLLIDKPTGQSSFDVIRRLRKVADTRKIGHTGTLDPQASGLLPLVVGKCTKLAQFLTLDVKEYDFELELGVETDTGDSEGDTVRECPWEHVTEAAVCEAAEGFVGRSEQVPPIYSAIKVDGRRAYNRAREGEDVQMEAREVVVESVDVLDFQPPRVRLHTRCAAGTYVRALVRDLGVEVGSCAYTTAIRRTAVGSFGIEEATPLAEITPENVASILLPPVEMMRDLPAYHGSERECADLSYGRSFHPAKFRVDLDSYVAVIDEHGELAAVTQAVERNGLFRLKPTRVLKAK